MVSRTRPNISASSDAESKEKPDIKQANNECKDALGFLRGLDLFSRLPEGELTTLAATCFFADIARGEYITMEGEVEPAGFIVASGRLAMMKTSRSGKELVVELLAPCDIFGLIMALRQWPAELSARAQAKSQCLWVPRASLIRVLHAHPELYENLLSHILEALHSSYRIARGLAHDRVEVRIAAIILSLALKFARPLKPGEKPIIDITRQQLAELTGTSPETAIRITRALQHKGVLNIQRPGIIKVLKLDALHELVDE
ncbi:Crp/Fnr family transcriptional regulator [Oligoflexia bacterium]|nr:Crp/Fnr family transcriptional regulator [Oligoflexia bacterium]